MFKKTTMIAFLAFVAALSFTATAFAGYKVKIVNNTRYQIKIKYARYKVSTWENCHPITKKKIDPGKSKACIIRSIFNTNKHKWQIKYKCNGKNYKKSSKSWKPRSGPSHGTTKFTITGCGSETVKTKIYS